MDRDQAGYGQFINLQLELPGVLIDPETLVDSGPASVQVSDGGFIQELFCQVADFRPSLIDLRRCMTVEEAMYLPRFSFDSLDHLS